MIIQKETKIKTFAELY
jgi:hypothetical protein